MNCRRAKRLVFEFMDGLTDERVQLDLERHLGECSECDKLQTELTRSMDFLHRAPEIPVDENFNWKVRLAINKEKSAMQTNAQAPRVWFRAWNIRYATSAVTGFAVVALVGWFALGSVERPSSSQLQAIPTATPGATIGQPANGTLTVGQGQNLTSADEAPAGAIDSSADPVELERLVLELQKGDLDKEEIEHLRARIEYLEKHLQRCKGK
jgi:hypothetical protein